MFRHFVFDFDGVLSDSRTIACQEINRLSDHQFTSLPKVANQHDLAHLYCGPLKTSLRRFGLTDQESADFFDQHSAAMLRRADEVKPFDPVLRAIAELVPKSATASIVTSAYSDAVRCILRKSQYFSPDLFFKIGGRELHQPKSKKIHALTSELQIPLNEVLHFGDMVSDILYSREVPVQFCAVGWGYHPAGYLCAFSPDHFVETFSEFDLFLKKVLLPQPELANQRTNT
jgi:phosphoglycolate phosphatase